MLINSYLPFFISIANKFSVKNLVTQKFGSDTN